MLCGCLNVCIMYALCRYVSMYLEIKAVGIIEKKNFSIINFNVRFGGGRLKEEKKKEGEFLLELNK